MPRNSPLRQTLDLHNFRASGWQFFETELFQQLDNFIYKNMKHTRNLKLEIIVGKGMNSKNFVHGKNPLRFYTEMYLSQAGFHWTNGNYLNGGEGVIWVHL